MKRSLKHWQIICFIFTAIVGTILHFLYDWLSESILIAPFSSVNESTWEHMKLLFWPTFIFAIVQGILFKERKDFWCVKLRGILLGLILIPIIFYTYNGVIGKSPDWLNITIYFICAAAAYLYEMQLFNSNRILCKAPKRSLAILCLIALLFIIFTFAAPKIGIFKDPITNQYGI